MMSIVRAVVGITLTGWASIGATAPAVDSAAPRIDHVVQQWVDRGDFSGVVLVADASGIVIEKGYGLANLEWGIPNTPSTRYRVGSISKQFAAAVVLKLIQEGRLSLDTTVAEVLPWYRTDTGERVSIRHLLNHTSGIDRSGVPRMIDEHACCPMPLQEEVTTYCSGDFEWEPGTKFAYNNAGYLILGAIAEEVTGMPYGEALAQLILEPVGMQNTGLDDPARILERRASGYNVTEDGVRNAPFVHATLASAAGGVYSTVGDLYLWDRALETDLVLSAATRRQMFTPGEGHYGYGWFILEMPVGPGGAERTVIRHPGQGDGFQSIFWRIPEDRETVILINNVGKPSLATMAQEMLAALHGDESPGVGGGEG